MPTTLTTKAVELSTFAITASFTDENGDAVTPDTMTWTLTDRRGNVLNGRDAVSITPATSVTVVLSGPDLALLTTLPTDYDRVVTFEGTYDSDLGSDLPLNDEVRFQIYPLVGAG